MVELLTRNTDLLRQEVAAHVSADQVRQAVYWDAENQHGCFIGCLNHSNDPTGAEANYGIPVMVQRIAESIFERIPAEEAVAFFAAFPDAVQCDGKDLSRVGWQFLAAELRTLPLQEKDIQAVIDLVIAGIDRLASGMTWDADAAEAAWAAARAAWAARVAAWGLQAARVARVAANAAGAAAHAAEAAAGAAADAAARVAAWAAADAATTRRQRDLLLRLIAEAEVET